MKCKICGYNNKNNRRICKYCGCYLHFPDTYIHIIVAIVLFLTGLFILHSSQFYINLFLLPYVIYIAVIGFTDIIDAYKIRKKNNIKLKDLREKTIQRIDPNITIEEINNFDNGCFEQKSTKNIQERDKIKKDVYASENSVIFLFVIACILLSSPVSLALMMSPTTMGNIICIILFSLFLLNLFCLLGREHLKNLRHAAVIADTILIVIIFFYIFVPILTRI